MSFSTVDMKIPTAEEVRVSEDTLTAWTVDDKLFTKPVTSSKALYNFVKKHLHDKALFGDNPFLVLKRVGK